MSITISEAAVKKINSLQQRLRLFVRGGGCAGFQYQFQLDQTISDEDKIFETDGAEIIIDDVSLQLIKGSTIDFKEDLSGSMFVIINPNAGQSCGCGNSFSL